jgi:hypothetical protein
MPFDRLIGATRVVNAGSVGMPFGPPGANWLLIADTIEARHTQYDLESAAARVRATGYPEAEEFAARNILNPPSEEDMARAFAVVSFGDNRAPFFQHKRLHPTAAGAIMSHRS